MGERLFFFRPGVGKNIVSHALLAARESAFSVHYKLLSLFLPVLFKPIEVM